MMTIEDAQRLNQQNFGLAMRAFGAWGDGWQSIANEFSTYVKRTFEDGTATFEQLVGSRTLDEAVRIQADYARRTYEGYMTQAGRFTTIVTDMSRQNLAEGQSQLLLGSRVLILP